MVSCSNLVCQRLTEHMHDSFFFCDIGVLRYMSAAGAALSVYKLVTVLAGDGGALVDRSVQAVFVWQT